MAIDKRQVPVLAFLLILLLGCVAVYFFLDPTAYAWMPKCPFRLLTGWSCPACGVQRALHALLNGHPAQALAYNYFFVFSVPYLLVLIVAYVLRILNRGESFVRLAHHPVLAWTYIVLFFVWGVLRNLLTM